ncbi:hypothetical protein PybrP1_007538 [[Pythium] brassicae (nom. inval.)]|nr:hypothetical protein PybrP1_007538 [[Pythium] brassicae (nom. inval.)]
MAQAASPEKRKWAARGWWVGLHCFVYAALALGGSLSPRALSPLGFAVVLAVAAANALSYVALQTSSPGFVERADLESGGGSVENEHPSDSDSLVVGGDADAALHFCEICQLTQPLRAKHCKDCGKCVRQYDHHCDCAGTCVGEKNRRRFVAYLFVQGVEAAVIISVVADAFSLQDSVEEWFNVNWPYLLSWFSVACVLLIVVPLFIYQAFLISTNQTSWEHARRSSITYLRTLPDSSGSPFDRGCLANWRTFVTGGDANKWVHSGSLAPPMASAAPPTGDPTDIM